MLVKGPHMLIFPHHNLQGQHNLLHAINIIAETSSDYHLGKFWGENALKMRKYPMKLGHKYSIHIVWVTEFICAVWGYATLYNLGLKFMTCLWPTQHFQSRLSLFLCCHTSIFTSDHLMKWHLCPENVEKYSIQPANLYSAQILV